MAAKGFTRTIQEINEKNNIEVITMNILFLNS